MDVTTRDWFAWGGCSSTMAASATNHLDRMPPLRSKVSVYFTKLITLSANLELVQIHWLPNLLILSWLCYEGGHLKCGLYKKWATDLRKVQIYADLCFSLDAHKTARYPQFSQPHPSVGLSAFLATVPLHWFVRDGLKYSPVKRKSVLTRVSFRMDFIWKDKFAQTSRFGVIM